MDYNISTTFISAGLITLVIIIIGLMAILKYKTHKHNVNLVSVVMAPIFTTYTSSPKSTELDLDMTVAHELKNVGLDTTYELYNDYKRLLIFKSLLVTIYNQNVDNLATLSYIKKLIYSVDWHLEDNENNKQSFLLPYNFIYNN